jgi:hypothetical protein
MDEGVRGYIDAIPIAHRPLFDRIHGLVTQAAPDAELTLAYKMPTFTVGKRRLFVGVWKHGVSMYGWDHAHDGGFVARHPELQTSTGTLRLRPADAAAISDAELLALIAGALG